MMSAPILCWMPIEISALKRCNEPLSGDLNVTPSSSTNARRSLPSAITSSDFMPVTSIASVFLKPAPNESTWNPPESVNVGPSQFMNRPRPPAASRTSSPGRSYRWNALDSRHCAPRSFIVSGSTAFIAAWVATGTNAGVRISPCGVWMIPVRPYRAPPRPLPSGESGRRVMVSNENALRSPGLPGSAPRG